MTAPQLQTQEANVDVRLKEALDLEDPDIVYDLRVLNSGRPTQYDQFLNECKKYIDSTVETAVDERRHDEVEQNDVVVHLSKAMSVQELHKRVNERLPEGTSIPSEQWLRLQFWLNRVSNKTAKYHTGKLKLKFMIQSMQFKNPISIATILLPYLGTRKNLRLSILILLLSSAWMTNIHARLESRDIQW